MRNNPLYEYFFFNFNLSESFWLLQAGVWLPFYRAHSNIETARREPYLFGAEVQNRIRAALRQRYSHLPVFYTLFFEHYTTGAPVIRPLFYHYPTETAAFDIDDQLLVGKYSKLTSVLTFLDDVSVIRNFFD